VSAVAITTVSAADTTPLTVAATEPTAAVTELTTEPPELAVATAEPTDPAAAALTTAVPNVTEPLGDGPVAPPAAAAEAADSAPVQPTEPAPERRPSGVIILSDDAVAAGAETVLALPTAQPGRAQSNKGGPSHGGNYSHISSQLPPKERMPGYEKKKRAAAEARVKRTRPNLTHKVDTVIQQVSVMHSLLLRQHNMTGNIEAAVVPTAAGSAGASGSQRQQTKTTATATTTPASQPTRGAPPRAQGAAGGSGGEEPNPVNLTPSHAVDDPVPINNAENIINNPTNVGQANNPPVADATHAGSTGVHHPAAQPATTGAPAQARQTEVPPMDATTIAADAAGVAEAARRRDPRRNSQVRVTTGDGDGGDDGDGSDDDDDDDANHGQDDQAQNIPVQNNNTERSPPVRRARVTPAQEPQRAPAPRVPAPEKFDGSHPEHWIRGMELWFHASQIEGARWVHLALLYLKREYQSIVMEEVDANGGNTRCSWATFCSILTRKYSNLADSRMAVRQLKSMRQGPKTLQEYITAFDAVLFRIKPEDSPPQYELAELLVGGLRDPHMRTRFQFNGTSGPWESYDEVRDVLYHLAPALDVPHGNAGLGHDTPSRRPFVPNPARKRPRGGHRGGADTRPRDERGVPRGPCGRCGGPHRAHECPQRGQQQQQQPQQHRQQFGRRGGGRGGYNNGQGRVQYGGGQSGGQNGGHRGGGRGHFRGRGGRRQGNNNGQQGGSGSADQAAN
jgi:hypothetical protein